MTPGPIGDRSVQLIDFAGTAKRTGREGSGPGEIGLPASVFAAPGDSSWCSGAPLVALALRRRGTVPEVSATAP